MDLAGLHLVDDPDRSDPFVFPDDSRIDPQGFIVLSEADSGLRLSAPQVRLFLRQSDGVVLRAAAFDREPSDDIPLGSYAEALLPKSDNHWVTRTPTPGAPNEVPREELVVINEIYYHPPEDRDGEFLEIYNRGTEPVDISGFRFTKGIGFTFLDNTTIPADGYAVIARKPDVLSKRYGFHGVLGRYEGQLADGGENIRLVDRLGNLVDEVRYFDGGRWSAWADGRGASLELVDPKQNNDFGAAWDASDPSDDSEWEHFSYTTEYVPDIESEFHLLLVEKGVCRIDDVSIVRTDDVEGNIIPNSGFETDTQPWVIEGTHFLSHRTTADKHSGEASLELVASGKGDSTCNRIETDTTFPLTHGEYTVSLWARWVRGSSLLIAHGEFGRGPWFGQFQVNLSNNSLGAQFRMSVPWTIGTPGAENSARRRLREETRDDNLGPVIAGVVHAPARPRTVDVVSVSAQVSEDALEVRAFFRSEDADEPFDSAALFDDGAHDDGTAGDGVFGGPIGVLRGKVSFYVEATDRLGAVGQFPAGAPDRTCLFVVGPIAERLLFLTDTNRTDELRNRVLHSNHLVDTTIIYDGSDVFYNAGVRYRGSPWGRPPRQSFRLRFPKDKPYLRRITSINLSNRDRDDGPGHFLIGRLGTPAHPAPAADYRYIAATFNDQKLGLPGTFAPVDRSFVEKWYGPEAADEAVVLKGNGRLRFNDDCERTGWDEATLLHMDEDSENYRFYWFHSLHQSRDEWGPFMDLTRLVNDVPLSDFDRAAETMIDLDAFFKVLGARIMMTDSDALFIGNGHNGYVAWDPTDGRWEYLPFDMGDAWSGTDVDLFNFRDRGIRRLVSRPIVQRVYFRVLENAINGYWSEEVAAPYLIALEETSHLRAGILPFLRDSAASVRGTLERSAPDEFRIETNRGRDFVAAGPTIEIAGRAPVRITDLFVQINNGDLERFEPTFNRPTRWKTEFPIVDSVTEFNFFGEDEEGNLLGPVSISVTIGTFFRRGDVDADGRLSVTDVFAILRALFAGATRMCADAADVDDDGRIELDDAISLTRFLYERGTPPASPFPDPGADPTADPTADDLDCR